MRKAWVLSIAVLLALAPSARFAHAQTLDDAIDAELDEVSGDSPSTAPKAEKSSSFSDASGTTKADAASTSSPAPEAKSSGSLDDIQLDDTSSAPAAKTAEAPAATPPTPDAPASDAGPSQGLVDDELKLDDDTAQAPTVTEESKKETPPPATDLAPDVELNNDTPMDVAKPSDEPAPDLDNDKDQKTQATAPPSPGETAPVVEQKPPVNEKRPSEVVLDNGNSAYEKKLSHISRGYKQVPDVSWDEIVGDRHEENYPLQRGDTLWDISETFFGDGFFWAKLWSQNGVIGNPHRILKGKAIRFVAGTEGDAPAIGVMDVQKGGGDIVTTNPYQEMEFDRPTYREQVQNEVTPEEIESGVVLEADELIPAPELPPPSKRVPLLKTLPKSFPELHVEADADYDASGFKVVPSIKANLAASVFLNSFILDGKPDDVGKVDEIETQEHVAAVGQGVFVRANKELAMGTRLTFIRRREKPPGAAGPVVDVEGVGVVDGVIKENSNTYHVTVTTALFPVEKGALVLEEAPPRVTMSQDGRHVDTHVKVVGGEFDDARRLLGAPAVIYLNAGSSGGLQKGDILGIEALRGSRRSDTKYPDMKHSIAVIKVADVRQKVATAVVLSSTEGIMVGDMTSGDFPEDLPGIRMESADESATAFGRKEPVDIK